MKNIVHTVFILLVVVTFALAGYSCEKYDSKPKRDIPCKVLLVTIITEKQKQFDKDDKVVVVDVVVKNDTIYKEIRPGRFIAPLPVFPSTYCFTHEDIETHELITNCYVFDAWFTDAPSARTPAGTTPNLPPYDLATKPIWLDMILYSRWLKISD